MAKDPKDETSYISYAIALANQGRVPEAINAVNSKLKLTPNDAQTWDILAKLYNAVGNKAKAQEANSRAQEIAEKEQAGN